MSEASTIITILTANANLTANAIAKAMGKTKARKGLRDEISTMVENGQLVADESARYTTYCVATGASASNVTIGKGKKKTAKKAPALTKQAPSALAEKTVSGYKIEEGDQGSAVITTKTGQEVPLNQGECLLIINGEPTWSVQTAEDVLTCISAYATEKGFATYVVSNVATGKIIGTTKDIKITENRIFLIDIKRHNKAA